MYSLVLDNKKYRDQLENFSPDPGPGKKQNFSLGPGPLCTSLVNTQCSCTSYSNVLRNMSHANGCKLIGHIYGEQVRLRNMSTIVAFRSKTIEDHVPTVPWLSVDSHLLVLGVGKSCTLQNQPHFYNGLNSRCKNRFIKRKIHCCQM